MIFFFVMSVQPVTLSSKVAVELSDRCLLLQMGVGSTGPEQLQRTGTCSLSNAMVNAPMPVDAPSV